MTKKIQSFLKLQEWIDRRFHSKQQSQMECYYEEVQNMYQQMRSWRHDYKNHLQVMKAHLDMGEYEELADYMAHLNEELMEIDSFIKTGSVMLDAILNSKISLARAKDISVNVKVMLPEKLSVAEYDLCGILGNLLDNAIEGCETQEKEHKNENGCFIRIYIGVLKEQLYVSVTNSHQTNIKNENGHYHSTKSKERGLGTRNIDRIVKRYQGFVNRQSDESIFATEILLPL